jgi:predicted TIM-barrel fold metal-dependent hydrolase
VRVSPFWWEPIDKYIERFEWLANVYVYGSDYPHFEGGKDPGNVFLSALEHLGPTAVEKFFVKNAELLMP